MWCKVKGHIRSCIDTNLINYPIQVNHTTRSCAYSRFRWNLVEGCSSYDVITSWPDLTWPNLFHQKLRKRCPISYAKFQHNCPNGVASSSEKLMGGCINPPDRARVKVWYEYKSYTKKTSRSMSGHKRSLYVRIVIKSCDICFMAHFRRRTRNLRLKYNLT